MRTTLADIAKKANVSKMTVSRVMSGNGYVAEKTAEMVKKIMSEYDYHPNLLARSLSSRKTMTLGVVIPRAEQLFLDNYIAQVLSGISDVALEHGFRILLLPYSESKNSGYVQLAKSNLFDGLILLKTKISDPYIQPLADAGFPFVLVNHKKSSEQINFIDSENIKGTKLALDYLYAKGHRKIAFVAGSMDETNSVDRFTGYQKTMHELGLGVNEDYIIYGEFNKEIAFRESENFLKLKKRPTAIFCSDDYMAIGVIERMKLEGLNVPNEVAIIGFDDIEIAAFTDPALTTIRQPMYEIGKTTATVLVNILNGLQNTFVHKYLKTELIIRNSA